MVNDIVVGILTYLAIKALEKLIEYIDISFRDT